MTFKDPIFGEPMLTPVEEAIAREQEQARGRRGCGTCLRRIDKGKAVECPRRHRAPRFNCPDYFMARDTRRWREDL